MNAGTLVPEVVQRRLEILFHKLEDAGQYVGAITVAQAQQLILDLTGVDRPDLQVEAQQLIDRAGIDGPGHGVE